MSYDLNETLIDEKLAEIVVLEDKIDELNDIRQIFRVEEKSIRREIDNEIDIVIRSSHKGIVGLNNEMIDHFMSVIKPIPTKVLNLQTSVLGSDVTLSWDSEPLSDGYNIDRDGSVIVFNHGSSTYDDLGLSPGTYAYKVQGIGQYGTGEWSDIKEAIVI